jgi:Domain of unknown function (DUF4352)
VYEPITVPPTPRRGRTALIVVAAVVAVCCGIGGVTSLLSWAARQANTTNTGHAVVDDAGAASSAGGGAKPAATTPRPPGIGTSVRDGVFEFTVLSLSCGHNEIVNGWLRATPQGQYCVGELRVANIGGSAQRFADGNQKAYGPDGKTYAADTGAGVVANGSGDAIWNVVNPGNSLSAKVVFDLPPGVTIVWLEVHDSAFSRGVKVWVGA